MVHLNDNAIAYMNKRGFHNIILSIETITSWCAPPRLEISVGFTDKEKEDMLAQGYVCETSPLGNVYYLPDGVTVNGNISINYMEYPWITCFEVSGLTVSHSWDSQAFYTKVCKRSCRWQVLCIICITLFHHNLSVLFFSVSFIFCISCSDCFICSSILVVIQNDGNLLVPWSQFMARQSAHVLIVSFMDHSSFFWVL